MNFPSSLIKNAVETISMFPGIGKKTALRLVIHLLRNKKQYIQRKIYFLTNLEDKSEA